MAGALYLLSLLTASFGESFVQGRLAVAAGLIAASGMVFMTLILYDIFKPVNPGLSLLAAWFNLVGLSFEALRWNPAGVDIALVFAGFHCLLIGYLIFRSTFLPRILGALMAIAGLVWVTYLSTPLANYLSPYNVAAGILGEGSVMLWLLAMGVAVQRWKDKAGTAGLAIACSRGHLIRSLAIQFSGGSMESLIALNCSTVECTSVSPTAPDLAGRPSTGDDRRTNRRDELHLPGGDMRRSRRSSRCIGARAD